VCSSSSIVFPACPHSEAFRKLLVLAGAIRDAQPLDHRQVVRQQQRIRRLAATALRVTSGAEKCKFLLRVDDFPSPSLVSDEFLRFHEIAAEHGLPYLLAVTPFFGMDGGGGRNLSEREIHILRRCSSEGAELALHGFSHRSRYRNYASELVSMPIGLLREELDRAETYLGSQELPTIGFVAPYNGYDPLTVAVLAERYPLLCGGPESVAALGYRAGPSFLMQSLYVPSYRGAYDIELRQLGRFDRLIEEGDGLIVPVTLHWANEASGGFRAFRAFCARLRGRTLRWSDLLARAAWVRSLQPSR
jgi:peptidoglycan/xylan/chitin deacetylase (PgdA/CDA1 family)